MSLISIDDYEEKAKQVLSRAHYVYYQSGAGAELTLKWNRLAYEKILLRPRVLRDVSQRSMACRIFDDDLDVPFGIAPTGSHKLAHADGELATVKAASNINAVYIVSCFTNVAIEKLVEAAPKSIKWMQMFSFSRKDLEENIVRKAEKFGFKAIVLTVDMPSLGNRRQDTRVEFTIPHHITLPLFENIDVHHYPKNGSMSEGVINTLMNPKFTWNDATEFIRSTNLPVILKGILTPEDAELAIDIGAKGIIVSNHGARQMDSVQATIDALPEIVKVVGNRVPVMVDGGIRDGVDVYKALALGAKMVFLGRPILWGLAANGQQGVESVLNIIKHELDTTMMLCGTPKLNQITRDFIICPDLTNGLQAVHLKEIANGKWKPHSNGISKKDWIS